MRRFLCIPLLCTLLGLGALARLAHAKRTRSDEARRGNFFSHLPARYRTPKKRDRVGTRILAEYGAVLLVRGQAKAPSRLVYSRRAAKRWHSRTPMGRARIGGISVKLQEPALRALLAASAEVDGGIRPASSLAATRDYSDTRGLWRRRILRGLRHYRREGQIARKEARRIARLSSRKQVAAVLRLEERGLLFGKNYERTILASVAAPGTSQHIAGLAFDAKEHRHQDVRKALARHGWHQTVLGDLAHFTYLGVDEERLPKLGLKKTRRAGRAFWIPDIDAIITARRR